MKALKFYLLTMMVLLNCAFIDASPAESDRTWSDTDGVFYLKTSDGLEQYTVDGTITFRAVADGNTIPSYRDCGVVFSPANEGEMIMITINSIDLSGSNYLLLYDGAINKIGYGAGGNEGQTSYLPDGFVRWYTSESVGETYTSTSEDGKLSFGFHSTNPAGQTGFDITVTSLSPKDMEYHGIEVINDLPNTYRNAKNQAIFGVNVITDGGSNPLMLDNLSIDCSNLSGNSQVTNVRLYLGDKFIDDALLATAATVGDNLTASNVTLKSGNNKFMVVADILPDATGDIPCMTFASASVAGETCTPSTSTGSPVTIDNTILMPAEATTFTIDDAANFYDDGGIDGKISLQFNGTVTFVPATAGHAIKVDFSKLDIFNTSSTGLNDVFKFYNGRTADENNLITTLLTEAETVKSTAEDGSMTIMLTSTTGVPKDGWEALVSEFLPGDMSLSGVTASAGSTTTVAAGETANALVVDVMTDNQSNPLSINALNLAASDVKNIDKATVYYLGKKNEMNDNNVFGEAIVTTGNIVINGSQELVEGHNYFAVVLDVKESALNGEQIDIALTSAIIGENTVTPAEALTAHCAVNNMCRATKGNHSHNVYDTWTFTNTEGYNGKYETEIADYIVTFTPQVENSVAEIDFSAFDVYYASSSYSTRAVFEIYSGTEVNSANLLWSLKDNSESQVGPDRILRSTAADGSLTIRFNPNTTSSYYAGTGWMAEVRPFINHAMTINSVTVNQTSTDVLAVGASDAALLDMEVVTEGTLSLKTIKGIQLDLKDTQYSLHKISVYYNNVNDRESAVLFGYIYDPETSEVTINGDRTLAEGSNYFWITIDVAADVPAETAIDAKITALVDEAGATAVEQGDPAGERIVKYLYNMESGVNIVTVNEPLMFYDDGGKDGNLTKGFKGTTIFEPGRENNAVQIDTKSTFSIGSGKMYIYSGREAIKENMLGSVTGYSTTTGPANLVSKAEDGSLTVVFEANTTASTLDGWEIEVSLHEKTPFVVEDITAVNTTDEVMRNSQDNPMQQIKINVSGDKNPLSIINMKFDATGTTDVSDITASKLYYTAHNASFSTDNLLGTLSSVVEGENVLTLDEPMTITENGDYYLWLTFDIAEEATASNTVAANALNVTINEDEMAITATAAERVIKGGLKGNYIIGASANADYATFAAATTALQGGIEGAVTFQVEDGTYAENIWFSNVPGVSELNTITFTSLSGNRDNVTVTGSGSSEYLPGSSSYKKGMVFIENTAYVTFEKMTFIPARESEYNYVICVYDRSRHFTLRNCHVQATPVTSGYNGINLVKTYGLNADNHNNDYATIENNLLEGGYIALALGGTNYVALTREKGLVVRGNIIDEAGSKGIYIYDEDDMIIENNTIHQSTTQKTSYWGIDAARIRGKAAITGNKIINETSYYNGGIELRAESYGSASEPILVYNNVVSITNSPSNSSAGIEIDGDNDHIALYNNTVRIAGNGGYAYYCATRNPAAYNNIKLQNNLFQNMTTSPVMFIHNNFISKPVFVNNAFYAETIMTDTDIDAINEREGSSGNIVEQAEFISETDLHLKSAGNLCMALPVTFITTDADGIERDAQAPTIGAYEYADFVVVTPEIAEGYPVIENVDETTATAKTKWNVSGKLYSMVEEVQPESRKAPAGHRAIVPKRTITTEDLLATTPVDYVAGNEATTQFKNLTPSTTYKAHFMLVSALDSAQSEVVVSEPFTTLRHIDELVLNFGQTGYVAINAGEEATLNAIATGGDEPYTYEWRDQMNNIVGTEATLTASPDYSWGYKCTITSADGQTVVGKTAIRVLGDAVVATFDDNYIPEEGYFIGDNDNDVFYSGSYAFHVSDMDGWWYGYGMSSQTSASFNSLNDQYHSAAGGGVNGSQFCSAYPSGSTIEVTNKADGDVIKGAMFTNAAYAYSSMMNGDGFAKKFTTGDWFKLTIVGTHADGTTSNVEFYLADLRDSDTTKHYILDTWKWVDLSSLGEVKSLRLDLSSSDSGQWGMNTPAYVCIDNLGAGKPAGDVNCDGFTTIADVTAIIDYLLGGDVDPFDLDAADVDKDERISIADATSLIDILLGAQ